MNRLQRAMGCCIYGHYVQSKTEIIKKNVVPMTSSRAASFACNLLSPFWHA